MKIVIKSLIVVSLLGLVFGGSVYDACYTHQLGRFNIVNAVISKEKKRHKRIHVSLNMRARLRYIAHAGGNSIAPPNTIPSFLNVAKDKHVWAIETDVHNTSDGRLILFHDDLAGPGSSMPRNNRYYGRNFSRVPYAALKNVRVQDGRQYQTKYTSWQLHIPTLMEYLKICKTYHKVAFVELKQFSSFHYIDQTIDEIKQSGMLKQTIITSKYLDELAYVHTIKEAKKIPLVAIYFHPLTAMNYRYIRNHHIAGVNMHVDGFHAYDVKTLHKMGVAYDCFVAYWKEHQRIKNYVHQGVDGLTVDSMALYYYLR